MQHPNTGPVAPPRLRPNRAPSLPALGGAGGRRRPPASPPDTIIRIRLPATLDGPFGEVARTKLEHHVARLIAVLDAWDGDREAEAEHEGCCEAADDDPASSKPCYLGCDHNAGEPDDAEPGLGWTLEGDFGCAADDDREQDTADEEDSDGLEEQQDDMVGLRSEPRVLLPAMDPCQRGPFRLSGREWDNVRFPR